MKNYSVDVQKAPSSIYENIFRGMAEDVRVKVLDIDKFGIRKIFADKPDGPQWFVNMDAPASDTRFRNLPTLTKYPLPNGSHAWQCQGNTKGQVRLEAWSPANMKYLNVEITAYAKFLKTIISGREDLLQMYSRGGHHTSSDPCQGSCYKARLYEDFAAWVKELTHPAYAGNRGNANRSTDLRQWFGFKAVIFNLPDGRVQLESFVDADCQDPAGNLVIRNNWQPAAKYVDSGGWATTNSDFKTGCKGMAKGNESGTRKRDEILYGPGGTSTANLAAWRTDGQLWAWSYLSVREILPGVLAAA